MNPSFLRALFLPALAIAIFTFCSPSSQDKTKILSTIDHVDPLIGPGIATTPSAQKHSVSGSELGGQTYPAVGVPTE